MKSLSKGLALLALVAGVVVIGCKNNVPTATSKAYPANPTDRLTLVNFETPTTHDSAPTFKDWGSVNSNILGIAPGEVAGTSILLKGGGGLDSFFGWLTKQSPAVPYTAVVCVQTDPSTGLCVNHAAHIQELFTDPGNGLYPVNQVRIRIQMSSCYDISNFKGVQFNMMYMNDDNAPKRRFAIATSATLPTGDDITCGQCRLSQCRNNFGVNMTPQLDGNWHTFNYSFTDLTQETGYGVVDPPDFTSHMKEVTWLQWESGRNNSAGSCQTDYWLDDVVFY
jgi:hypothetical protein